jgi:hypothetical protein
MTTPTDKLTLALAALRQAAESSEHCPCCGEDWPGRYWTGSSVGMKHADCCFWPTVEPLLPLLLLPAPAAQPDAFDEAIVAAYLAVPVEHRAEYRRIRRVWAESEVSETTWEVASRAIRRLGLDDSAHIILAWQAINNKDEPELDWSGVLAACEVEEDRRTKEGAC